MKKALLIAAAAVIVSAVGLSEAKMFDVPSANTEQPASIGYGGVNVATANFTVNFTTVATGPCVAYGVTFSSGKTSEFVQIYATGTWSWSGQGGSSTETIRLYNLAASTGGVNVSDSYQSAGYMPIGPNPIRLKHGCGFRASVNSYNSIIFHYISED